MHSECSIKGIIINLKINNFKDTVNSEIFSRILSLRKALKDIFVTLKIMTMARFSHINNRQSDLAIVRGFYFHETFLM